jgi:F-type H+-transporting ATPase subunit delta
MAEIATIARPYANAVFELAKERRAIDEWSKQLQLAAAVAAQPQILEIIESPATTGIEKSNTVARVCGDDLSREGKQFVLVLARNKRLHLIGEISAQFEALRAQEEASLDVEVVSAFALSETEQRRLVEALGRRFDREIQLTAQVDESLIGGAVIRAGDTVIDGSVKGKLEKLAETLQRA